MNGRGRAVRIHVRADQPMQVELLSNGSSQYHSQKEPMIAFRSPKHLEGERCTLQLGT